MSTHDIQIITTSRPLFPPPITPAELKAAYAVYRKQLIADNNLPPLRLFSHMASLSYSREPRHVKIAYVHLSTSLRSMQ
ncbi:17243_t:CDS:2 [Cetraspora pellucida]|uniref:17243_t:CDS:1 n=1 Tax=Cetraspora pellucida TaxID=1433469 RepID=A0A9N9C3Z2_9GLOM|nr:17243_t:CDS:2 [Cetraspora pellucida]